MSQYYVIIYYVMGGDEIAGAKWAGIAGLVLVPAPLISFGNGGLFTLVPAMIADVVDVARTLTLMRVADIGIPVLTSAIALWAVSRFPITEEVARSVRRELEERRGKV